MAFHLLNLRKLQVKLSYCLSVFLLAALGRPAFAQAGRDQAEARVLYHHANSTAAGTALRAAMKKQGSGFFGDATFKPGALRTYDNRYRPMPGLRFHTGLQVVEAQDSIDTDSTHLWLVGSLRGFDMGEADASTSTPARRFRTRLVKEGSAGTRREFVEVITSVDAGPLLLAWLYTWGHDVAMGRSSMMPLLLVGPGTDPNEPLRPIELNQTSVLRLFGSRANEIRSFAIGQQLQYDQPADVARMIDHFNRVAVVK